MEISGLLCLFPPAVDQRLNPHGTRIHSKAERDHRLALEPLSSLGSVSIAAARVSVALTLLRHQEPSGHLN